MRGGAGATEERAVSYVTRTFAQARGGRHPLGSFIGNAIDVAVAEEAEQTPGVQKQHPIAAEGGPPRFAGKFCQHALRRFGRVDRIEKYAGALGRGANKLAAISATFTNPHAPLEAMGQWPRSHRTYSHR